MALEILAEPTVEVAGERQPVQEVVLALADIRQEIDASLLENISSDTAMQDAFLNRLMKESTDYVETYIGRSLGQRIYRETRGSRGDPRMVVGRYPLSAIGYIQERRGLAGNIVFQKIERDQYEIEDSNSGFIYMRRGFNETYRFDQYITQHPSRFRDPNWEVKYRAGYVLPSTDDSYSLVDPASEFPDTDVDLSITAAATDKGPPLPYDLRRAALQILKVWVLGLEDDPSVVQEKVGDASETRWNTATGFGPTIMATLDRYRQFIYDI